MSKPKFNVGDLVLFKGLLGRVNDVYTVDAFKSYFYKVGELIDVFEDQLTKADWRDENRILKGGPPCHG